MLENELFYRILALTVLAVFYGIYFIKMAAQAKQGIRTHQIGRRRKKGLHTVETIMSIATLGVVIVQLAAIALGHSHICGLCRRYCGRCGVSRVRFCA